MNCLHQPFFYVLLGGSVYRSRRINRQLADLRHMNCHDMVLEANYSG